MLIILTGKTASGKDTIKFQLQKKYPNLKKIITTTSRQPRKNETSGLDYHFISRDEFVKKVENGEFVEHVEYGGNLYGTQKKDLEEALEGDCIWKIDPSRAGEVREFIKRSFPQQKAHELIKNTVVIYITTSNEEILERLNRRGLPSKEIQNRMEDDSRIWEQYKNLYDFIVENEPGKLEDTLYKVYQIIESRKQN